MGIVNHTYYPYIYSTKEVTKVEYRTESGGYWSLKDWHDGNTYWYCAVFCHGGNIDTIDFTKLIPNEILVDTSIFIVLCTEYEAFTDIVEPIYKNLIKKLNIEPKRIILISENYDIINVVNKVAESYQLDSINVEWSLAHERHTKTEQILSDLTTANILDKKSYSKAFINFNRRWRIHRPCFVGLLYSMNLLDKGFVSLGKSDDDLNWTNTFDDILKLVSEDEELFSLLTDNKTKIVNLPELYLDTTDLITNPIYTSYADTIKLYEDSYFSIVSETCFFENVGRAFTEKTFKPILYKHPFILIAHPNSLELLRSLGYRTFHPFIDESYDSETNNTKRLKMILSEVKRLSNFSETELFEFIDNVKEITIHNHNTLINKPKFTHIHKR